MKSVKSTLIVIYRPYKTLKNGKRIYASCYGKKAFRFEIPAEKVRK